MQLRSVFTAYTRLLSEHPRTQLRVPVIFKCNRENSLHSQHAVAAMSLCWQNFDIYQNQVNKSVFLYINVFFNINNSSCGNIEYIIKKSPH